MQEVVISVIKVDFKENPSLVRYDVAFSFQSRNKCSGELLNASRLGTSEKNWPGMFKIGIYCHLVEQNNTRT